MIIEFSKNLKEQRIYANGDELANVMGMDRDERGCRVYSYPAEQKILAAVFKNPVLVTDTAKIGKLAPGLRDTIFKLMESPVKTTIYDDVSLNFNQKKYAGAWGPSIDTLLFCRALNKISLSAAKTSVEIGAGSGFITKYFLMKNPQVTKAEMIDLNPRAIECCEDNIKDSRASFTSGDGVKFTQGRKFDVIFCNPPYIPRPKSIDDNPYEGTGLLEYLIRSARDLLNPGGKFITNFSSLSEKDVLEVVKKTGVKARKIDSMTVPLKVCSVLNNKKWVAYLLKHGLKKNSGKGYDFYHKITIMEIGV